MRIISKFKDYYDSAASLGVDVSQVFVRNSELVDSSLAKNMYSSFLNNAPSRGSHQFLFERYSSPRGWSLRTEILGFCGEIYPLFVFKSKDPNDKSGTTVLTHLAFTLEGVIEILKKIDEDFFSQRAWLTNDASSTSSKKKFQTSINDAKMLNSLDLFHELKSPYWLIQWRNHETNHFKGRPVVCNPILKDLGFQKIKDSFTANQEINQFYFGVMACHGKDIPTIADKYMIESKGFDTTYGFRKRP